MRIVLLVIMFVAVGCAFSSENAERSSPVVSPYTNVRVFDCEIEIPVEYKLNTHEESAFRFSRLNQGSGSITISQYDASIKSMDRDDIEIVSERIISGLEVISLKAEPGYKSPANDVVVMHDNSQAITIIGDDIDIWRDFISQCESARQR